MEIFISNILNLLTSSPGNLLYHLILVFTIAISLQAVLFNRRQGDAARGNRLLVGFLVLLAGQVILFLSTGLAWQGLANPHLFLPPLDRGITLLSLIWIVWMWVFSHPVRLADALAVVATLAAGIFFFFSLQTWLAQSETLAFNASWLDVAWELSAVILVLIAMVGLLILRPSQWGAGLAFLTLNLVAHTIQLIYPVLDGDYAGIIRLGHLITFPLLPALANRLSAAPVSLPKTVVAAPPPVAAPAVQPAQPAAAKRPYAAEPRAVYALLQLAYQNDPARIPGAVAKVIAQIMVADLCLLFSPPSRTEIIIQGGFDLIREQELPGATLPQKKVPNLTTALQRGKSLFLANPDSSVPEFKILSEIIGLKDLGTMMFLPLLTNQKVIGGLMVLSPYSKRIWNSEDQDYLISATDLIARILVRASNQVSAQAQAAPESSEALMTTLNQELSAAREENDRLLAELAELKQTSLAQTNPDIDALVVLQRESQEMIASLQAENDRLQALVAATQQQSQASSEELTAAKSQLDTVSAESARLLAEIEDLQAKNQALQSDLTRVRSVISEEDREVIASIIQELRQPMASIVGYSDLMLSESVGILGALQQKFLERIKSSTERMRVLLDDLLQIIALQQSGQAWVTEYIEMSAVLDQAIRDASRQLQEKKINLRVDLPAELPRLKADRDAIQQILVQLLQNASQVTPNEGNITLRFAVQHSEGEPYLRMEVTDSGGGVRSEDLPRVFARRYRADNPLIQGVGDTGVGLSIAKTLVDAHKGRIWVDSDADQHTTTFTVLLPIQAEEESGEPVA